MPEPKPRRDLLTRLRELRQTAERLLFEREELSAHLCPSLAAAWTAKVGVHQCELFEIGLKASMLRWKCGRVQAKLNRQEAPDLQAIELEAALEFEVQTLKLASLAIDVGRAVRMVGSAPVPAEEAASMKAVYRAIVKRLHPDINPVPSDEDRRLFKMAADAFRGLDLPTLNTIAALVLAKPEDAPEASDEALAAEIGRLGELIAGLEAAIADVKNSYPYNKAEILDDPHALEQVVLALTNQVEGKRAELAFYEERYAVLTGAKHAEQIH